MKKLKKKQLKILAVDPGEKGYFILYDGDKILRKNPMPMIEHPIVGKQVDHSQVLEILETWDFTHLICERSKPMGQGMKQAFNYGRYFESLLICFDLAFVSPHLVDPSVWAKVMHKDVDGNYKAKAKSIMVAEQRFPQIVNTLPRGPKNKKLLDGPIDALLIAAYYHEILTTKYIL